MVYYNEFDKGKAAWLRELMARGVVAPGVVDERSICDVRPADLAGFAQCHFFAGIGVWSYALRNAGWSDERPVWTGSCPCQPFSAAGRRKGFEDERHLFPAWAGLIKARRPGVVFGEQVSDGDGLAWLDAVFAELDPEGYTIGAVDSCAAGFGAPMRSQRLYIVAEAAEAGRVGRASGTISAPGSLERSERLCSVSDMGATDEARPQGQQFRWDGGDKRTAGQAGVAGPVNGFWRDAEWIWCRDEKWRAVESGSSPLAHGAPARVLRIRGYGDAIVAPQAEAFIRAYMQERGIA